MSARPTSPVPLAVRDALMEHERTVLAVSGGLDSMTLLHAAAAVVPRERLIVATFDHGTGDAAAAARDLVAARCAELAIECVVGRADQPLATEAAFRSARWRFLREVARDVSGPVATAHTRDDQVETVLMRLLRGAGARGLAGLYAASDVLRPFIGLARSELANYAALTGVSWIDDPSNESPRFFRNRVRHDLLPALRCVRPALDGELLDTVRMAAEWRREVDRYVDRLDVRATSGGGLDVRAGALTSRSSDDLAVLWPAIAARAGVTLDRRGTHRLAEFTTVGRTGGRIQLAGGWTVVRSRDAFELRASAPKEENVESIPLDRGNRTRLGNWSFHAAPSATGDDAWSALLPEDRPLVVRSWRSGDAMAVRLGSRASRVKRLLSKAGVTGHDRDQWPVVLAGDQIVWIPGVSRSDAATARSGRPGLPFRCEYHRR